MSCYECLGKVCGCWRCGSRSSTKENEMQMFNVYCEGRWMAYEWATSAAEAIGKAQDGLGPDNARWTATEAA